MCIVHQVNQVLGFLSPWLNSDPKGETSLSYMDRLMMDCFSNAFPSFFVTAPSALTFAAYTFETTLLRTDSNHTLWGLKSSWLARTRCCLSLEC